MPWVAAAVAGAVAVLGFVVLGLRAREQVSFFGACRRRIS